PAPKALMRSRREASCTPPLLGVDRRQHSRIVARIEILKTERPDRRYLRDVLAGLCPMEMGSATWQHDHAARWKGLDLVAVKLIAEADVEHVEHDRVDPVLRMLMRHESCAVWCLDPDDIRAGLGGMTNEDSKTHRRRKGWKRFAS